MLVLEDTRPRTHLYDIIGYPELQNPAEQRIGASQTGKKHAFPIKTPRPSSHVKNSEGKLANLWTGVSIGGTNSSHNNRGVALEDRGPEWYHDRRSCVVVFSQHKSAGVTLYSAVKTRAEWPVSFTRAVNTTKQDHINQNCDDKYFNYVAKTCMKTPAMRTKGLTEVLATSRIAYNGLVLTLAETAAWSPSRCVWITMFREPISRLISAMTYCRRRDIDPLCGNQPKNWYAEASAEDWAAFWGNYLLRELLLHPSLKDVVERGSGEGAISGGKSVSKKGHVWQRWRSELSGGDRLETSAGRANLDRALGLLPSFVHAFGVVEKWPESMELLDCTLPLRGGPWVSHAEKHRETHGGTKATKMEEAAILKAARSSPVVAELLAADSAIYGHALALHGARYHALRSGEAKCSPYGPKPSAPKPAAPSLDNLDAHLPESGPQA
jgi:hypothetical protein